MTKTTRPEFISNPAYVNPEYPNTGGWKDRHYSAILNPKGFEKPIANMLTAWIDYAVAHQDCYGSEIGDDPVLGEQWEIIGRALNRLLNGDTGNIDCGSVNHIILTNLAAQGWNPDIDGERI